MRRAVRAEGHGIDPVPVPGHHLQELALVQVPEADRVIGVIASEGEPPAIGAHGQAKHVSAHVVRHHGLLAGGRIHDMNGIIPMADDAGAVRSEGQAMDGGRRATARRVPVAASQRRLGSSADPAVETSRRPSGLKARSLDGPGMSPAHGERGAGVGVPQPHAAVVAAGGQPAAIRTEAHRVDGIALLSPGHGDRAAGRRLPQAQRVVLGDGSQAAAVGAEGHAADRALVPGQDPGRLVELAVEVVPLPLAERLGRRLEDPPGGRAVVQLQGRRRRHQVRPVQLLAGRVPLGQGIPPLPDDPREPQDRDHQDRRRQARLDRPAPGPLPGPPRGPDRPRHDRPARQETAQVIRQRLGRRVTPVRLLLQALQADGLQVARDVALEPARRHRLLRHHLLERGQRRGPLEGRPAGEHLVQERAQAVDIDGGRDLPVLPRRLFGGDVAGRAQDLAAGRQPAVALERSWPSRSR